MSRTRPHAKNAAKPAAKPTPKPIPTADAALEQELRLEVKRVIQTATPDAYPAVSARLVDVQGYQQVEDAVINVALHNAISFGSALALLESEWGGIA